jgi:hypothetical protein
MFDFRYDHIPLSSGPAHMRFSYSSSYDHGGSSITETGLDSADKLVILGWWEAARLHAHRSDRKWMMSINSLKATGEEMGRPSYCIPIPKTPKNTMDSSLGDCQVLSPEKAAPSLQ